MASPVVSPGNAGGASSLASPTPRSSGAEVLVWGIWSLMLVIALLFVARYGSATFFGDDWAIASVLTGEQPVTLSWLWSQHNEHRIPLPRLTQLAIYGVTGNNLRAPMFFNVLLLGVLALAMIHVAAALRGRSHLTDAFFPLVLLHLGQQENLLWSWQVGFVLPTVLVGVLLLVIVAGEDFRGRVGQGVLAGVCLILLPLCGANGLLWVPPLAIWVGLATLPLLRAPDRRTRRGGLLIAALLLAALLLCALYLIQYEPPAGHPPPRDARSVVLTTTAFLSMMFGSGATQFWPLSGVAALALVLVSALMAMRGLLSVRHHADRSLRWATGWRRALGILLFLGAAVVLALSVGWGRAAFGFASGFQPRYATLIAPALCAAYFAWALYAPLRLRVPVQAGLFAVMALLLLPNYSAARYWAVNHRWEGMQAFEQDLRAGLPPDVLVERHMTTLSGGVPAAALEEHLRAMHRAGIGHFRYLRTEAE